MLAICWKLSGRGSEAHIFVGSVQVLTLFFTDTMKKKPPVEMENEDLEAGKGESGRKGPQQASTVPAGVEVGGATRKAVSRSNHQAPANGDQTVHLAED